MRILNRRHFLGTSGALLAGHVTARTLSARSPNDTIGIGCIGVGNRGTVLLRNLLTVPGVRVVAICDIEPAHLERAQKLAGDAGHPTPKVTGEWKELLDLKEVEAVISALPCDLHAGNYVEVLSAGKDLYGERPMCLSVAECNAVVAAADWYAGIVQIGLQRRSDPRFIDAIRQVHEGELGELLEGRIVWSNAWGPLVGWFGLRERSGDWMVEQAVHNWDVMNWANRCLPVQAVGMGRDDLFRDHQPERNVHDYYSAVVRYENGVIVNIVHSWVAAEKFDQELTRLAGTRAGIDFNTAALSYRRELNKPDRVGHGYQGNINSTGLALENFVKSLRSRTPPVATVGHGRDAVLASLLVRRAVYTGEVVRMKDLQA